MDDIQRFWWNWWVSAFSAIGTLIAVVVAVFGDKVRNKFFPPTLKIDLPRPQGDLTRLSNSKTGALTNPARYYHLRIANERRWSPAHEVQFFLLRIDAPGPNGEFRRAWEGNVPLMWRDQSILPARLTIGPVAYCDLFRIEQGVGLQLLPIITPNNLTVLYPDKCHMIWTLQVRSNELDAAELRVEVAWDGLWADGEVEMQQHAVVKLLS